ncbi:hypothetical protein GALL_250550 [mine drainage metagenome]|uniref:Uncharacterized protein n=1 Tax=mine drainage metagenome TaxID=410659 RepID=A0A1J5RY10_9ZZZZ
MFSSSQVAEQLRSQASAFAQSSDRLLKLADEIDPPDDDELLDREIREDDDALWTLFIRVYHLVMKTPGITTNKIASGMGLPGNYPTENSHHFTAQILDWLMDKGLVYRCSDRKPYQWMANPVPKTSRNLRVVKS